MAGQLLRKIASKKVEARVGIERLCPIFRIDFRSKLLTVKATLQLPDTTPLRLNSTRLLKNSLKVFRAFIRIVELFKGPAWCWSAATVL